MLKQYQLKDYNFRLVIWLAALSAIGVLLVGSAKSSLQTRHLVGVLMGMTIMVILSLIDFSWVLNFAWILYFLNLAMLTAVIVMGSSSHGAQRWIEIGGFQFQPVEVSKIILIIFFANYFMQHENDLNKPRVFLRALLLIGLPLILVLRQPDLKNTITIAFVFAVIYFAAGLSWKYILAVLGVAAAAVILLMTVSVSSGSSGFLKGYQLQRIMAFRNSDNEEYSDDNIQQNNSVIAIGSGELYGKGLNNSDVTSANKGNFISEIQTDFIFAVAGEELGFFGSAGIVILLLLIEIECLLTGLKSKDLSGRIICCGMAALVAFQSFVNIGVATRLLPNTGTPLPFVSYGLTSLISLFIGMGFVLNVGLQSKIKILPSTQYARMKEGRAYK